MMTLVATLGGILASSKPVAAHPSGEHLIAEVSLVDPHTVRVHWQVGQDDDLAHLAHHLGLLPAERVMLDGAVLFEEGDPALLQGSPKFSTYLTERIGVTLKGGGACDPEIVDLTDVGSEGATLEFTCASEVGAADVRIAMLTDQNPDYTTIAAGPDGREQIYDGRHETHAWTFDSLGSGADESTAGEGRTAESSLGGSAMPHLSLFVLAAVAMGGAVALWVRTRRGDRPSTPSEEHEEKP